MPSITNIEAKDAKCKFLEIMLFVSFVLLIGLNIYIAFEIVQQFKGDSWSFLGGFIIATAYFITIPATVFSLLSIKWNREGKSYKITTPLILSVIGILMGIVLHNAFEFWWAIIAFGLIQLISVFVCTGRDKKAKDILSLNKNIEEKTISSLGTDIEENENISTFRIVKVIQIIALLISIIVLAGSFSFPKISVVEKFITISVLILYIVITIAFLKKKKWALKIKRIIAYILLVVTVIIFLSFLISDGLSLSSSFLALLILFIFIISVFVYLIYAYKKLFKAGLFISIGFIFLISLSAYTANAQDKRTLKEIHLLNKNAFSSYVEFYSSDIKDVFNPNESGKYSSTNLFDGFLKTCWVGGDNKTDKTSSLYIHVPDKIDLDQIILNIFSGYGKSKALYKANARPKKIKLSLFSGFYPEGFSTEVVSLYLIKLFKTQTIVLADTFGVQSFSLNINKDLFLQFQKKTKEECKNFSGKEYKPNDKLKLIPHLILRIEILDSYPGTKYTDVCISELFFNNRFVTAYPNKYKEVQKVYIENDNTLFVDYKNRKRAIVFKDTSSVFTMVDHPEKASWAILHYVPNNSVEQDSRIEESYSLVDLRNNKIVEKEFEKCTGQHPYLLEKNNNGKILLTTVEDTYKIELK